MSFLLVPKGETHIAMRSRIAATYKLSYKLCTKMITVDTVASLFPL